MLQPLILFDMVTNLYLKKGVESGLYTLDIR
jgi:hypothetical protein